MKRGRMKARRAKRKVVRRFKHATFRIPKLRKLKIRKLKRFRLRRPSKVRIRVRVKKSKSKKHGKKIPEKTIAISKLKEEYIETSVDKLYNLIEKRGKVSVGYAARVLGFPKTEIEEWAKALAGHGLIELNYGMFSTTMRKKVVKK